MTRDFPRFAFRLCWLGASVLLLAGSSRWLSESVPILAPVDSSLLSGGRAWNVPLVRLLPGAATEWPFVLFAVTAGGVIAGIGWLSSGRLPWWVTTLLMAGLCLTLRPQHLPEVALMGLAGVLAHRASSATRLWWPGLLVIAAALLLTLDFTIPLLVCGLLGLQQRTAWDGPAKRWLAVIGLLLLLLAIDLASGSRAALLRPVSWWSLGAARALFPELGLPLSPLHRLAGHLCLVVVILDCLSQRIVVCRSQWTVGVAGLVLAVIGIGCGYYTALCSVALVVLCCEAEVSPRRPPSWTWLAPAALLVLAAVRYAGLLAGAGGSALVGGDSDGLVDPRLWRASGPVMLVDLAQAGDWQSPALQQKFPLLLSDRWDAADRGVLQQYAAACQDLSAGKRELYLRSDGSWGGFAPFLRSHEVVLIAVDATDLMTIRRTSIDPDWRVMSIDGHRTIFGRSDLPDTGPQTARAGNLIGHLEWPRAHFSDGLEGTLALGTPAENRRVAETLNAIRLPYAAQKILADDDSSDAGRIRTWCHAELAHRVLRQTGTPSLRDHPRALIGLRQLQQDRFLPRQQRASAGQSLRALARSGVESTALPLAPADRAIRAAVRTGDLELAQKEVQGVESAPLQAYYRALLAGLPATELIPVLTQTLQTPIPAIHQEEALFYLGCLYLESGAADRARSCFSRSVQVGSASPLAGLRDFYLAQMSR